jgi:hypothetical protein
VAQAPLRSPATPAAAPAATSPAEEVSQRELQQQQSAGGSHGQYPGTLVAAVQHRHWFPFVLDCAVLLCGQLPAAGAAAAAKGRLPQQLVALGVLEQEDVAAAAGSAQREGGRTPSTTTAVAAGAQEEGAAAAGAQGQGRGTTTTTTASTAAPGKQALAGTHPVDPGAAASTGTGPASSTLPPATAGAGEAGVPGGLGYHQYMRELLAGRVLGLLFDQHMWSAAHHLLSVLTGASHLPPAQQQALEVRGEGEAASRGGAGREGPPPVAATAATAGGSSSTLSHPSSSSSVTTAVTQPSPSTSVSLDADSAMTWLRKHSQVEQHLLGGSASTTPHQGTFSVHSLSSTSPCTSPALGRTTHSQEHAGVTRTHPEAGDAGVTRQPSLSDTQVSSRWGIVSGVEAFQGSDHVLPYRGTVGLDPEVGRASGTGQPSALQQQQQGGRDAPPTHLPMFHSGPLRITVPGSTSGTAGDFAAPPHPTLLGTPSGAGAGSSGQGGPWGDAESPHTPPSAALFSGTWLEPSVTISGQHLGCGGAPAATVSGMGEVPLPGPAVPGPTPTPPPEPTGARQGPQPVAGTPPEAAPSGGGTNSSASSSTSHQSSASKPGPRLVGPQPPSSSSSSHRVYTSAPSSIRYDSPAQPVPSNFLTGTTPATAAAGTGVSSSGGVGGSSGGSTPSSTNSTQPHQQQWQCRQHPVSMSAGGHAIALLGGDAAGAGPGRPPALRPPPAPRRHLQLLRTSPYTGNSALSNAGGYFWEIVATAGAPVAHHACLKHS